MEHGISKSTGVKRRIYGLVQGAGPDGAHTDAYDIAMMAAIALSMVPVMFKETNAWLHAIDWSTAGIFIVDYALRWWTADLHVKKGKASYVIYPFTPMAIVDLLSILPVFTGLNGSLRLLRLLRAARARVRCSFISSWKAASSTLIFSSSAISFVRSRGKP